MRRAGAVLPVVAVLLAGCPIPQTLPDYPAGTVTPPRILVDELAGDGNPIIFVPANCTTTQVYSLSARVVDTNTIETIAGRWFVNYDPQSSVNSSYKEYVVPPNADTTNLIREVPPRAAGVQQFWAFRPYDYPPAIGAPDPGHGYPYPDPGILRVVELVVSNGFDPSVVGTAPLSNRAALPGFETQVYRWVFLSVPQSATVRCDP